LPIRRPSSEDEVEALKDAGLLLYVRLDHHRKIQSLKAIVAYFRKRHQTDLLHQPINIRLGERHLGESFTSEWLRIRQWLSEAASKNVDVLNLVFDLEAYNFVDTNI
jgi:hypothetical protein